MVHSDEVESLLALTDDLGSIRSIERTPEGAIVYASPRYHTQPLENGTTKA